MVFLMNLLIIVEVNEFEDGSVNINWWIKLFEVKIKILLDILL